VREEVVIVGHLNVASHHGQGTRRAFLLAGMISGLGLRVKADMAGEGLSRPDEPYFKTRGVVITPEDVTLGDWPERAKKAGLTTIALHPFPGKVLNFVPTDEGARFLERCRALGLQIEYELHAMRELLPRELFARDQELFRMDEQGHRVVDANLCVHSSRALETAAASALRFAGGLRPSTGRYFFWGDDGQPWCRCPKCRELTDSDQALIFENHLIRALRRLDPGASLAHLAYANTLAPPRVVKPEPGIFLEYAPIKRRYDLPYEKQTEARQPDALSSLDANLEVFPAATAQVLEYWLDVSRFSGWRRPAVKLPWRRDVLEADLSTYAARGIRHVTSFAVYVDADYRRRHGEPGFLGEYGESLRRIRPGRRVGTAGS
jgi:hypothetical protein